MTNKTKITVKERKPGTSRKLCKMPISTPEKAARSTAKLFSNADHVLNAKGIAMDISTNSVVGRKPTRILLHQVSLPQR
jgi:hypothetical protein